MTLTEKDVNGKEWDPIAENGFSKDRQQSSPGPSTSTADVIEQYRPIILSSLKFSRFTLGTVAPQFTGVSIIEDDTESVTMELEMQWDANSSIIPDIKTYLGVLLRVHVLSRPSDFAYLLQFLSWIPIKCPV